MREHRADQHDGAPRAEAVEALAQALRVALDGGRDDVAQRIDGEHERGRREHADGAEHEPRGGPHPAEARALTCCAGDELCTRLQSGAATASASPTPSGPSCRTGGR